MHRSLLLAGQETTASTLNWFLWEIARHPESQERIREEITTVYRRADASGVELTVADLDGMAYTQAALKVILVLPYYFLNGASVDARRSRCVVILSFGCFRG